MVAGAQPRTGDKPLEWQATAASCGQPRFTGFEGSALLGLPGNEKGRGWDPRPGPNGVQLSDGCETRPKRITLRDRPFLLFSKIYITLIWISQIVIMLLTTTLWAETMPCRSTSSTLPLRARPWPGGAPATKS